MRLDTVYISPIHSALSMTVSLNGLCRKNCVHSEPPTSLGHICDMLPAQLYYSLSDGSGTRDGQATIQIEVCRAVHRFRRHYKTVLVEDHYPEDSDFMQEDNSSSLIIKAAISVLGVPCVQ